MLEFFLGGARSGKSRLAEQRINQYRSGNGMPAIYFATAQAGDAEMQQRIAHHRQQREINRWQTIEVPLQLGAALRANDHAESLILIDCLTLWLSNCLHQGDDCCLKEREDFLAALETFSGTVILVSNEVGQGIVPLGELSRRFVDEAGRLHQEIAARADRVVFCVAGLPQILKG
jgi:adenosylcobinamide kinase/adenosylcobinamide-phosphate guanylyltransferase